MVRTRDTATVKVVGAKAPRKASFTPAAQSSDDSAGKSKYSGGNSYCPRETPNWQKNITCFFGSKSSSSNEGSQDKSPTKAPSEGSPSKVAPETAPSNESTSASSNDKDSSNKENVAASSSSS